MTKPVTPERRAELAAEAGRIEGDLARLPELPPMKVGDWKDFDRGRERRRKAVAVLVDRLATHGAKFAENTSNGACTLRHLGVSTSCTSGAEGLLRNWITAARRKAGWEDL